MSYEGYEQHICRNGHLFNSGCSYHEEVKCDCGAESVWVNAVDETNGDSFGEILASSFEEWKLTDRVTETCPCCQHTKVVAEATYRVPTEEERKNAQTYHDYKDEYGIQRYLNGPKKDEIAK